ncbi:MAG: hypothetical protein JXB08_03780 [Bacilli bacterium]|nr:hypothetical protein [Bacilli bacterium]
MATYKKGYKKQNTETVLLQVIIGIIVAVFGFVAIAFIYDAATQWKDYNYYTLITEYNGITEYKNGTDTALEDYVVYFYQDSCTNCSAIKTDALRIGNRLNADTETFFLANTTTMTDDTDYLTPFLDAVDLTDTEFGTPALLVVVDGQVAGMYVGSTDVLAELNDLIDGNVEGFDF